MTEGKIYVLDFYLVDINAVLGISNYIGPVGLVIFRNLHMYQSNPVTAKQKARWYTTSTWKSSSLTKFIHTIEKVSYSMLLR